MPRNGWLSTECSNLEDFFSNTNHIDSGDKILFIDSLDEHPEAQRLVGYISQTIIPWLAGRLGLQGPDWNYLNSVRENKFYEPYDKNRKLHWNRFTGLEWDLDIPQEREQQQMKDYSKVDWEEDGTKTTSTSLKYAYSSDPIHAYVSIQIYDYMRK